MTHPFIEFLQKKYYIENPDNAFEMFCESNTNQILAMIEDYKLHVIDNKKTTRTIDEIKYLIGIWNKAHNPFYPNPMNYTINDIANICDFIQNAPKDATPQSEASANG